jgi:hypothetical protein
MDTLVKDNIIVASSSQLEHLDSVINFFKKTYPQVNNRLITAGSELAVIPRLNDALKMLVSFVNDQKGVEITLFNSRLTPGQAASILNVSR